MTPLLLILMLILPVAMLRLPPTKIIPIPRTHAADPPRRKSKIRRHDIQNHRSRKGRQGKQSRERERDSFRPVPILLPLTGIIIIVILSAGQRGSERGRRIGQARKVRHVRRASGERDGREGGAVASIVCGFGGGGVARVAAGGGGGRVLVVMVNVMT